DGRVPEGARDGRPHRAPPQPEGRPRTAFGVPAMILDFERPIKDCEERIADLRRLAGPSEELRVEISRLEEALDAARKRIYSNLSPYQRVQVARPPERPNSRAYRDALADDFYELSGDRLFGDDPAVRGGLARIGDHNVILLGHDKGTDVNSRGKA